MAFKDDFEIPIKCLQCKKVTKSSLGKLERNPTVKCSCGSSTTITGSGLKEAAREFDKLEKSLKDFSRKLR